MTRDAVAFHPSKGVLGTAYMSQDGDTYVYTPWGIRKVDRAVGVSILDVQQKFNLVQSLRRRMMLLSALVALVVGVILGGVLI